MTFSHALATNNYGPSKFIVDASAANGTHTTIATALTSASSGDTIFIRPGTYTENLTLKAGVNLTAYICDANTPNVTIVGKCTATFAGTCSISGIALQTNSDFFLALTGSSATIVNLDNCYFNISNNTGINYTSSSSSSSISCSYCFGNLGTTGIALHTSSSAGSIQHLYCDYNNTGASTTITNNSAGTALFAYCLLALPVGSSSTGNISLLSCNIDTSGINTTSVTANGTTSSNFIRASLLASGTASALTVGTGAISTLTNSTISSSNTNAITGAGTIRYAEDAFIGTSSTINTTTQTPRISTEIHQVNRQVFTGNGTYTPTAGMKYCDIECIGGGGGGGGAATTDSTHFAGGAGGAGGEYARGIFSAATIGTSQSVTIGTAGAANSGAAGGNGGNTSVGSTLISANGGTGGGTGSTTTNVWVSGVAGGTGGTGGDFRTPGSASLSNFVSRTNAILGGTNGANTQYGAGGISPSGNATQAGVAGLGYGAGGSGGYNATSQAAAVAGGAGTAGIVIVTEYI